MEDENAKGTLGPRNGGASPFPQARRGFMQPHLSFLSSEEARTSPESGCLGTSFSCLEAS